MKRPTRPRSRGRRRGAHPFTMLATLSSVLSQTIPDSLDSLTKLQLGGDPPRPPPPPWAAPFAASAEPATQRARRSTRRRRECRAAAQACRAAPVRDAAVATLVSSNEGYPAGGRSGDGAARKALVSGRAARDATPAVEGGIRTLLAGGSWEVVEVGEVRCNQVLGAGVTADKYDLGEDYQRKKAKWLTAALRAIRRKFCAICAIADDASSSSRCTKRCGVAARRHSRPQTRRLPRRRHAAARADRLADRPPVGVRGGARRLPARPVQLGRLRAHAVGGAVRRARAVERRARHRGGRRPVFTQRLLRRVVLRELGRQGAGAAAVDDERPRRLARDVPHADADLSATSRPSSTSSAARRSRASDSSSATRGAKRRSLSMVNAPVVGAAELAGQDAKHVRDGHATPSRALRRHLTPCST